jgi:hypothetical protein
MAHGCLRLVLDVDSIIEGIGFLGLDADVDSIIEGIGLLGLDADVDFIIKGIRVSGLLAPVASINAGMTGVTRGAPVEFIIRSILTADPLDLTLFDTSSARTGWGGGNE